MPFDTTQWRGYIDLRTSPVLKPNSFRGFVIQYSSEYQIFGILELLLKQLVSLSV